MKPTSFDYYKFRFRQEWKLWATLIMLVSVFAYVMVLKTDDAGIVRGQSGIPVEGRISNIVKIASQYSFPTSSYLDIKLRDGRTIKVKEKVSFIVTCRINDRVEVRETVADNGKYFYHIEPKICVSPSTP